MKKGKILWMAVIAAMVLVPTLSWAQAKAKVATTKDLEPSFMVEIYAGGGGATSTKRVFRDFDLFRTNQRLLATDFRGTLDPYVLGGIKFGYWFNPNGTFGIPALPDWMKYIGFYTDFSYHKLDFGNRTDNWRSPFFGNIIRGDLGFDSSGSLATWAFMFAGRLGFLPDSEVPFGRLQPYAAVGPAIFFSYQDPTFNLQTINGLPLAVGFSPSGQSAVNIGLAVEGGVRYFVNKHISVQASFKYRYFAPKYNYSGTTNINNVIAIPFDVTAKPSFNLYSGQIGVAYHF